MSHSEKIWPKKITVDKRIVEILSGSTYENFPKALKEIITNSYDADSSEVRIMIDEDNEMITIIDNGKGMDEDDFDFYFRIAGRTRKKESKTAKGRNRIGKFGVGFLSVFPFFQNYHIESSKKGQSTTIYASINCAQYFTGNAELKDVDEIPIQGGVKDHNSSIDKQYTKVTLTGFTKASSAFFNEQYKVSNRRKTILKYPSIDRLIWELQEDLPLLFRDKNLNEIIHTDPFLDFDVSVNGDTLYRNKYSEHILDKHDNEFHTIGDISFKYFIATNYGTIDPVEGRYFKLRNLDVGVGERESFGIGLEGRLYAKLAHLSGEINVVSGLNDLIKVSRDSFNFSHDFEEFKEFFRKKLRYWSDELDKISELQKINKSISDKDFIDKIDNINSTKLTSKVKSLEKRGYTVKRKSTTSVPNTSNQDSSNEPMLIDKDKKEIVLSTNGEGEITKQLNVGGRTYKLKTDSWDVEDDLPAVKIEGKYMIVNQDYPLFHDKKYFDVFLKFSEMFVHLYNDKTIDREILRKINEETIRVFQNYY